jgi:hypothetical protein
LLQTGVSPKRDAVECLLAVGRRHGIEPRGLYLDLPDRVIGHPLNYYFRRVRPWTRAPEPSPERLARYLDDPAEQRPILTWEPTYQQFRDSSPARLEKGSPSMIGFGDDVLLLLPGPYAVCGADARVRATT